MTLSEAYNYRVKIESVAKKLDDADALEVIDLFPSWKVDMNVVANERYKYEGDLYKVVQSHHTQADWTPDKVPALFTKVSVDEWPEWVQPTGSQDAYNTGDKVTYKSKHYVSLIDGNVWSPEAYPAGWEEQA